MGLAEMASEGTGELWTTAKKKDGTEITYIKECTDLVRFDKEEHEVSQAIYKALNEWLAADPENKNRLKDFKQGFSMVHTDGNKYRIIQFRDGGMKISRWKAGSGGGSRGGFRQSYIHLRVEELKLAKFEEANDLINSQEPNDNWRIETILDRTEEQGGPIFVMTNSRPYTPKTEGGTSNAEESEEDKAEG